MDKELIDRAWACLPREFREEVKKEYYDCNHCNANACAIELEVVFGCHNLTSDAEGEEMLCVSRKRVQELYKRNSDKIGKLCEVCNADEISKCDARCGILLGLFGSKCLPDGANEDNFATKEPKPFKYSAGQKVILHFYGGEVSTITEAFRDGWKHKYKVKALPNHVWNENELDPYEEPKPAEPKFKVGDKVKVYKRGNVFNGAIGEIIDVSNYGSCYVLFPDNQAWFRFCDLEPYTEPAPLESGQPVTERNDFDNIIKDGFSEHNRLHIAAMAMQGILSNIDLFKQVLETGREILDGEGISYRAVAKASFCFANAMIAESEKGGSDGKD